MPRASSGKEHSACGHQNENAHVRYAQTRAAMGRGEIARERKKYFSPIANFQNLAKRKNRKLNAAKVFRVENGLRRENLLTRSSL
jgi:hypothetical protein